MLFNRGHSELNERLEKRSRFTMSCYNCDYFYQTEEDSEEVCQNPTVLKYDMVVSESNVYCNQWTNCKDKQDQEKRRQSAKSSVKSIFKKRSKNYG